MSNYRIAVLGDKDSVLGFKALGLDVYPAENVEASIIASIFYLNSTSILSKFLSCLIITSFSLTISNIPKKVTTK